MRDIAHLMRDLEELLGIPIEWDLRYVSVEDSTGYHGGFQVILNQESLEAIIKAVEKLNKGDK